MKFPPAHGNSQWIDGPACSNCFIWWQMRIHTLYSGWARDEIPVAGRKAQEGKLIGWMLGAYLDTSLAWRTPGFDAMWLIVMVFSVGVSWLCVPEQAESSFIFYLHVFFNNVIKCLIIQIKWYIHISSYLYIVQSQVHTNDFLLNKTQRMGITSGC